MARFVAPPAAAFVVVLVVVDALRPRFVGATVSVVVVVVVVAAAAAAAAGGRPRFFGAALVDSAVAADGNTGGGNSAGSVTVLVGRARLDDIDVDFDFDVVVVVVVVGAGGGTAVSCMTRACGLFVASRSSRAASQPPKQVVTLIHNIFLILIFKKNDFHKNITMQTIQTLTSPSTLSVTSFVRSLDAAAHLGHVLVGVAFVTSVGSQTTYLQGSLQASSQRALFVRRSRSSPPHSGQGRTDCCDDPLASTQSAEHLKHGISLPPSSMSPADALIHKAMALSKQ